MPRKSSFVSSHDPALLNRVATNAPATMYHGALGTSFSEIMLKAFAAEVTNAVSVLLSRRSVQGSLSSSQKKTWNPSEKLLVYATVSSLENNKTRFSQKAPF